MRGMAKKTRVETQRMAITTTAVVRASEVESLCIGEIVRWRVRRPGKERELELEAERAERRISMAMKENTASTMKRPKEARKAESTVRMAADSTMRNESTAR